MGIRIARGALFQMVVASLVVMGGSGFASAADMPKGQHPALTKETREKMATLHEQMATCLRSDKTLDECRKEMMKNCEDSLGKGECPMMDMHHHHGMRRHPADTTAPK